MGCLARVVNMMSNSSTYMTTRAEENARDLKRVTRKRDAQKAASVTRISLPFKFACTLSEKVVFAVNVYHAVLEYTLPLILDSGNLVVGTKDNIAYAWTFFWVLLAFRVRII